MGKKGMICWSWDLCFGLISCSLCSGTSGFGPGSFGLFSGISGGLTYTGSGLMVLYGMTVFGGGDWGCGGDGGCSVMMVVDGVVYVSGSSWMSIIWDSRVIE
jgi:hypothetical protein